LLALGLGIIGGILIARGLHTRHNAKLPQVPLPPAVREAKDAAAAGASAIAVPRLRRMTAGLTTISPAACASPRMNDSTLRVVRAAVF
jgi:hypothetical protein